MRFWVGLVLICGVGSMPDSDSLIIGSRQACSNEGEEVIVDEIEQAKCFSCMCKNGFVECQREHCPSVKGCFMILDYEGSCCNKCKGCLYKGEMRESGSEWRDPEDPCRVFTCMAGVVTETREQCYSVCDNPLPRRPGQCCQTCPSCRLNGQLVTAESNVRVLEDPCLRCQCPSGRLSCSKKACPVLHCPQEYIVHRPGDCCPICNVSRSLLEPPSGRCLVGFKLYEHGNKWEPDRCTWCLCNNGTTLCHRPSCPVLDCPREWQTTIPGHCCPHCPTMELNTVCTVADKTYKEGETWQLDQCKSCVCKRGQVRCAMQVCNNLTDNIPCPPNHRLMKLPGKCCPTCVESDSVCTVFGDPHYRTFDGKFYSFQGSCKYQLTADCIDHTFSIRVTNDARSTRTSSWTKTVSIKVGDLKINLGERRRVKVNGVRVTVPYERPGVRVTEAADDSVLVECSNIGLKVLWDGNSFLEVSAAPRHKGRLCGLCGNYNSDAKDDFTTRRGRQVQDPDKFGSSWRVGGKRACTRPPGLPLIGFQHSNRQHEMSHRTTHPKQRTPHQQSRPPAPPPCTSAHKKLREKLCRPLRSSIFAACHKKLNHLNYYKSCLVDTCECPSRGRCQCESFNAYSRECWRLGVPLPHWRLATGCLSSRHN